MTFSNTFFRCSGFCARQHEAVEGSLGPAALQGARASVSNGLGKSQRKLAWNQSRIDIQVIMLSISFLTCLDIYYGLVLCLLTIFTVARRCFHAICYTITISIQCVAQLLSPFDFFSKTDRRSCSTDRLLRRFAPSTSARWKSSLVFRVTSRASATRPRTSSTRPSSIATRQASSSATRKPTTCSSSSRKPKNSLRLDFVWISFFNQHFPSFDIRVDAMCCQVRCFINGVQVCEF